MVVSHISTLSAYLDQLPIVDGQLIVIEDADGMYYDMSGKRHPVKAIGQDQFVTLDTEQTITGSKTFTSLVKISKLVQGESTSATGNYAHAEGQGSKATGSYSHAEGLNTTSSASYSHAEGNGTHASGLYSHAEGNKTTASGQNAHAEGSSTNLASQVTTSSDNNEIVAAWASRKFSLAKGQNSHVEGVDSLALGTWSHAEGQQTIATGSRSHSQGNLSTASGENSHAEGYSTTASNYSSLAVGKLNAAMTNGATIANTTGTAFVIGNGTSETARSNALSVQYNGVVKAKSTITASTTADYAEFFEWLDGNPDDEDRVGYFVTLVGDKIKIAAPGDYILGVVSGEPFVLGNGDCDTWTNIHLRDEFRRTIYEPAPKMVEILDEEGLPTGEYEEVEGEFEGKRPVLNPEYDCTQEYISRFDRPEWAPVGMLGVLAVRHDGTAQVDGYVTVNREGIATSCEEGAKNSYRVIKSNTENVVEIVFAASSSSSKNVESMTQAQYDELAEPDSNTIYYITDGPYIIQNGVIYGKSLIFRCNKAEYDALPDSKYTDSLLYLVEDWYTSSSGSSSSSLVYQSDIVDNLTTEDSTKVLSANQGKVLDGKIEEAANIAKGRNRAHVFSTTEAMQAWLSDEANKGLYNVGDNIYIVDLDVPDWWISAVLDVADASTGYYYNIAQLETQKVDLTEIESSIATLNSNVSTLSSNLGNLKLSFRTVSRERDSTYPNVIQIYLEGARNKAIFITIGTGNTAYISNIVSIDKYENSVNIVFKEALEEGVTYLLDLLIVETT